MTYYYSWPFLGLAVFFVVGRKKMGGRGGALCVEYNMDAISVTGQAVLARKK